MNIITWVKARPIERLLTVILTVALLTITGGIIYNVVVPGKGDAFTEFYMAGEIDKVERYLRDIEIGEPASVKLGIINREGEPSTYRIEVTIDGARCGGTGTVNVGEGKTWEGAVVFTPVKTGKDQKIEFNLYRGSDTSPCVQPLRLWVNVEE